MVVLGGLWGGSWAVLGASWGILGHLGGILGRLKCVLARFETVLGRHGSLEAVLGALSRNKAQQGAVRGQPKIAPGLRL